MHTSVDDIRLPLEHGTPTSLVRRIAQQALRRWGLTDHADDVLLVATELVQNVTQHTDDGGELRMTVHNDAVLIEVTDTNPAPPHMHQPDPDRLGGRGVHLIVSVARRWGIRPGFWAGRTGTVVWAEIASRLSR